MKKLLIAITSALLCMTMLVLSPAQLVASAADNNGKKYISEVKVGMGVTSEQASKELLDEGYTILTDDSGNYADLNKDAGSKSILKGGPNQKIVYLGYKTTGNVKDAITDLAAMNMNGGYSYEDYEKLMQTHMDTQIKPFVDRFISTLKEYRENLAKPNNTANFKRADYFREQLNKLTDDDCNGNALGDLLINETKYELGDDAYNKLSNEQKWRHCDILTLLMQGNGQAVQLMETLLTKAADSTGSTWLDRFKATSLEKLTEAVKEENPNMTPSEINQELDKRYNDNAKKILDKWEAFNEILINYDNSVKKADEVIKSDAENKEEINTNPNMSEEEKGKATVQAYSKEETMLKGGRAAENMVVYNVLEATEYGDGTLLEFFERDKTEFEDDEIVRELYPIVDSLTGGQLAGLDFLSLKDMILMAVTDENGYKKVDMNDVQSASIYQDVNREIYEKGGVALTDAALRAKANAQEAKPAFALSNLGCVLWGCTAASGIAAVTTLIIDSQIKPTLTVRINQAALNKMDQLTKATDNSFNMLMKMKQNVQLSDSTINLRLFEQWGKRYNVDYDAMLKYQNSAEFKNAITEVSVKSNVCKYLAAGFTVLGAVLAGVSIYTTIKEMMDYYKVNFVPIPKYIVERADITATNEKGETVMIKNQTAYYKAVLCNRTDGSSDVEKKNHEILKDRNDLNGDVGMQWLSLYSVKYENGMPILADSLKLKMGSGDIPEGYTTGIHRFGETNAFNLTSRFYCYNDPNDGTYVYFKNETSTVKDLMVAGSVFSGGSLAIGVVIGLLAGAGITILLAEYIGKRKKTKSAQ